ncbi:MAG: YfiR family protein [Bacteroidales bacterium]|nr:YfiR family protein [Bacteroidales bacterium]MBN2820144.1 YfiR family protein [Bacteroidales bacterium]
MKKFIGVLIIWIVLTSAGSQTGIPRAQAMFIYNFSRLIEWPASYKDGPFIIGSVGSSQTYTELLAYTENKSVGSQTIQVKKFDEPNQISNCHILFVPFSKTKQMSEVVSALASKSTLIICEKNGAIDEGAAINFLVIGDKLKFEVKPSNATSRQIKLSSKLSEMAFKTY